MSVDASLFLVSVQMGTRLRGCPDGTPLLHRLKVCQQPPRGFHNLRILDLLVKKWRGWQFSEDQPLPHTSHTTRGSSSRRPPWWQTCGCSPRTCARSSPSGATRSRRRSTPTRPPTPRGSVTSRQTTTRSSSPRAWARRPRTRASRPRALPRTNKSHGQGHRPKTALSYSSESIRSRTSCDGVVPRS